MKFDVAIYKKPIGRIKLRPELKTSSHLDKTEHRSITFSFSKLFHGTKFTYVTKYGHVWHFILLCSGREVTKQSVTFVMCVRLHTFMSEWVFVNCTGWLPGSLATHSSYVEFRQ